MKVRRKGADDCCCNDWKNKIKELWEKYQNVVRGVKFGDNPVSWPDGDGIVQVDTEGLIDVDHTLNKLSINPVANAPVADAIETLATTDQAIENDVLTLSGAVDNINDALGGFEEDISVLSGRISTVDGKVDLQNSYNAATRAIANSAQQTAETFDDRLDSVEESDAIQDQQIAALQDADAENAKLAGDNAFTGNNSFAVNPKAAAPASGAVDTSIVNANWVSQSGANKPNNLLHDLGNETALGLKEFRGGILNTSMISSMNKVPENVGGKCVKIMTIPAGITITIWYRYFASPHALLIGCFDIRSIITENSIHKIGNDNVIDSTACMIATKADGSKEVYLKYRQNRRINIVIDKILNDFATNEIPNINQFITYSSTLVDYPEADGTVITAVSTSTEM